MGSFWAAALAQVRSWPRDRLFIWLLLIAPLSGMVILDGLFADGLLRRLPVAVCDLDGSSTSRELIRRVDALPSARVAALLASPDEGRDAIRRGEVFAVLVIPRHFERDLLRRRPVQAIAYIDGQHMPVGSVLRRDLVDLGTAGWKLAFTDTLRRSGVPPVQADWQTAGIGLDLRSLGNPAANYKIFLVHSFLPILLQLTSLLYSVCVLHRLRPERPSMARVWGSVCPAALLVGMLGCLQTGLLAARGYFPLQASILTVCVIYLLFSLACAALAVFIAGLCDEILLALMMVSGLASPAFAFAEITFPQLAMPPFARFWSGLLPSTQLLRLEGSVIQMGDALGQHWPILGALCLLACVYGGLGSLFHGLRSRRQEEEIAR